MTMKKQRKPTIDINLQLYQNDANAIQRIVELTGQKRVVVIRGLIPPIEIIEGFNLLADSVEMTFTDLITFLLRDALLESETTRQKVKKCQEAIKALGGKL